MKNKIRTLGITAALAVMIPLSAYAATTGTGSTAGTTDSAASTTAATAADKGADFDKRGKFGREGGKLVSQEVLDLLKLDQAGLDAKLKAGSTLAEIAGQQGITREQLKTSMTEALNKQLEAKKKEFSDNLDKTIDSKLTAGIQGGRHGGALGKGLDLTAAGTVLGLTADEVKEQLTAGKSLADLAKDKGIDAQKLIDAQAAAITSEVNQQVKDGKLTQAQADERLKDVAAIAEKVVNGKGFGRGKGHGFRGGMPPAAATSDTSSGTDS